MFENDTDPMIVEMNCSRINNWMIHSGLSDQWYFIFDCHRTERLLGYLTLLCMFIPGLLLSLFLSLGLKTRVWLIIIITPICTVLFPILTIFIKIVSLFHCEDEFQRLNELVGTCEFFMETGSQLLLHWCFKLYWYDKRLLVWDSQTISVYKSIAIIGLQFTKFFTPKIIERDPQEHSFTFVKKIVWSLNLNLMLVISFLFAFNSIWLFWRFFHDTYILFNYLVVIPVPGLFICICLLYVFRKSLNSTFKVKLTCILCALLFLLIGILNSKILLRLIKNSNAVPFDGIVSLSISSFLLIVFCIALITAQSVADVWFLDKLIGSNSVSNVFLFISVLLVLSFWYYVASLYFDWPNWFWL